MSDDLKSEPGWENLTGPQISAKLVDRLLRAEERLDAKVDLFERVIRHFVEMPTIYLSPSFHSMIEEMGYEYYEEETGKKPFRSKATHIRRKA